MVAGTRDGGRVVTAVGESEPRSSKRIGVLRRKLVRAMTPIAATERLAGQGTTWVRG